MENFPSPDDALSDLRKKGYEADLNFETDPYGLYSGDLDMRLNPEGYHVDESLPVDDPSHPNESETVYAISTSSGVKGTLMDVHDLENRPDAVSMLYTLAGIIGENNVPVDEYLRQMGETMTGCIRITGPMTMSENECRDLFSSSSIIEFMDWAETQNASNLWDRLYRNVIKPLGKRDLHFIFHLGNVAKKLVFDIDEVLDIIGDYTSHGKVTLMLSNEEAGNLWNKLNGRSSDADISGTVSPLAKEKYQFIFNTMRIDSLVVLQGNSAGQLSREGEVILPGRPSAGNSEVVNARARFSIGYQMGLLLQLKTWHYMALGLTVLGVEPDPAQGLNSSQLLAYIHSWISDF